MKAARILPGTIVMQETLSQGARELFVFEDHQMTFYTTYRL
jgi:hypothetical protein